MGQVVAVFAEKLIRAHSSSFEGEREREGMNYLLMLAHLYNLNVVHCTLIYDLVNYMCSNFDDTSITQVWCHCLASYESAWVQFTSS